MQAFSFDIHFLTFDISLFGPWNNNLSYNGDDDDHDDDEWCLY